MKLGRLESATLDEATGKITFVYWEGLPDGEPNPVNWSPTRTISFTVNADATVETPTTPEITEQPEG